MFSTLMIHDITSLKLGPIETIESEYYGKTYTRRKIEIKTTEGSLLDITLFGDELGLTLVETTEEAVTA